MFDVISSSFDNAWQVIAPFGWYMLAVAIAYLYFSPYLQEKYSSWREKKSELEYSAKYRKDPDAFQEKLAKMEAARQRMQEKYERDAEIAKQKEQERIEKKRQQLLELTGGLGGGQKLGQSGDGASTSGTQSSSKSSSLKSEYNPLMGDTSRGYRAPKRSCCKKGGGCG